MKSLNQFFKVLDHEKTNQKQRNTLRIAEYQSAFLTPTGFLAKDGKTVYVSPEFHEKYLTLHLYLVQEKLPLLIICIVF
ncbi:DUF3408 domain-containing protein [Niabella sp. W65]|nr:DUF3408 domain-containing protein [Niabella sp. W65]MCH7363739.1 DUF3408 domain-containing protein [Niabella sp. W65]ULT46662.1 DUF3408 domain-containing protein [Niabella sp. I65]